MNAESINESINESFTESINENRTLAVVDPGTREGLIAELNKVSWLRLRGLLDGMMVSASSNLFEEIRNAATNTRLSRNFNSMRGLMICKEMLVDDFSSQSSKGWSRLADHKLVPPLVAYDEMAANAIRYYALMGRHNNTTLLKKLDVMIAHISGKSGELHPLSPEFLLKAFWSSTRILGINTHERLVVMRLFNRYVIDDGALVWNRAVELMMVNEWMGKQGLR